MKNSTFKPKADWKPLKRSAPMARGTSKLKPIGARAKRMGQGKVKPTAEEQAWMAAIAQFCIVCRLHHGVTTPAEVHHFKDGDRRMGHLMSIGLCVAHHRGGAGEGPFISRHPWKKRFEESYGTEMFLLHAARQIIAQHAVDCAGSALGGIVRSQKCA